MMCEGILKTLLWVANFVLFAAGALLLGAGIYVYTQMNVRTKDYLLLISK